MRAWVEALVQLLLIAHAAQLRGHGLWISSLSLILPEDQGCIPRQGATKKNGIDCRFFWGTRANLRGYAHLLFPFGLPFP
jgi:hypothetical protein